MLINGENSGKVTRAKIIILIFFCMLTNGLLAQTGGDNTYDFLTLTNSARIAAMGGDFLSVNDSDLTLAINTPSLINPSMNHFMALSIVDYYADINYGFAAYSRSFEKYGSFMATVQFVNYGKFDYADDTGLESGKFGASEMAVQMGWARKIKPCWSVGSNLKFVYSAFEGYHSYGLAVDFSGSYFDDENGLSASLNVKNIGWQIKAYRSRNKEAFPFEIQFGFSKRLKHLPFRYSVLVNHLDNWSLCYDDQLSSGTYGLNEETVPENKFSKYSDELFRHVVVGGELLLSENFILRLGYNYKRRKELGVSSKMSTVGFSWGFEFKILRFRLSYARSAYHLAGSPNYFTITADISNLFSR